MSCPNTSVSPQQEQLAALIEQGENEKAIDLLEAEPALIKQCDRESRTPLHVACEFANEAMVNWLCKHRADARKIDAHNRTPMDCVVLSVSFREPQRPEPARHILQRLVSRGAQMTPLSATALGDCEAIRRIHVTDPNRLNESHRWHWGGRGGALSAAVIFEQADALELLLDLGLPVDEPIALGRNDEDEEQFSWGGPRR